MPRFVFSVGLATLAIGAFVACGGPGPSERAAAVDLTGAADAAAAVITAEGLAESIIYLASDDLRGRGPGSPGDELTQQYLIERMEALGFEPAGPGGAWKQPFEIVGVNSTAPESWTFQGSQGRLDLKWWDEYIASSGVQQPSAAIADAELVFVGFGIQAPEYEWDDYAGADLSGKVLVMMNNDPDWDPELFEGNRRLYYGRWTYKYEKAAEVGAAGAIIIHTTPSAGYPFQVVQTSWTGEQFEIPAGDEPRLQIAAWTTEDAMRRLLALGGHDLDALRESARSREFRPVPLGIRTSLELSNQVRRVQTANVLGILRGRDPELSAQVIVYSAHHDHLGVGKPNAQGDDIYNGALDNASGCAQVLEIARAFTALPERPRRSILLAFVAAEEQGLLGSAYWAGNPTVAPGLVAANLNYDGANIWGRTRDVTYIGLGKSSLDDVIIRYAGEQGRSVKPDQFPDRGFFYRSDQLNFARIGVPAVYLDTGTEFVDRPADWGREQIEAWESVHYHQPSDQINDDWSFEGMIDDARLGFEAGLWIAEQDEMPSWKPGDEFEAARLEAIAALGAQPGS